MSWKDDIESISDSRADRIFYTICFAFFKITPWLIVLTAIGVGIWTAEQV